MLTQSVSNYSYNIDKLDGFKSKIATLSPSQIVPIAIAADSIGEGANSTAYLTNGFISILRDVLQSKYGSAGSGLLSVWRRLDNTPNYLWAKTGTWTDKAHAQAGATGATAQTSFIGTGVILVFTKGSVTGEFTVQIDGGTVQTFDSYSTTSQVATLTIDGLSSGSHTILLTATEAGKSLWLTGIIPINGSTGVRVDNFGWYGRIASSDAFLMQAYNNATPLLTIIALVANDYGNGTPTPLKNYKASISGIIDNAKANGSDVLIFVNGLRGDVTKQVDEQWYAKVLYELSDEKGVALIDANKKWGTPADAATNGYLDSAVVIHPNDVGHRDMANLILQYLL